MSWGNSTLPNVLTDEVEVIPTNMRGREQNNDSQDRKGQQGVCKYSSVTINMGNILFD